jgi:hypothetical protein
MAADRSLQRTSFLPRISVLAMPKSTDLQVSSGSLDVLDKGNNALLTEQLDSFAV